MITPPRTSAVIISEQYDNLIKRFKPQFGNLKHIEIAREVQEIGRLEKLLNQKKRAAEGIKELEARIEHLKADASYLLKSYSQ